jgi:hypothetical protein
MVGMQFPVVKVTVPETSTVAVGAEGDVGAAGAPFGPGSVAVPGPGGKAGGAGAGRALAVVAVSVAAFEHRSAREQACTAMR